MKILEKYHPQIRAEEQTDLISIIITAYNIEDYIERGIRSVCAQTYRNLEILVVEDGSSDSTGAVCDRIALEDARIRVIHQPNKGVAQARNTGLAAATGQYLGFVDGDDWIDPDMYEKMLGAVREQAADLAICRYRQVHKGGTEDQSVDRAVLFEGQEALQYYVQETKEYAIQNAVWNKLYRREILTGFSFPPDKWYEDILFVTRVLGCVQRCIYLDTACYNYIIDREGSIMNAQINPRTFTDQIPAYYEKTAFLRELGREDLAEIHNYFFYKRLLLFYYQVEESELADKEAYLRELARIIQNDQAQYAAAFGCPAADLRDAGKMRLFLQSPARYCRRMRLEEKVIIPVKSLVKRALGAVIQRVFSQCGI